MRHKFVGITQRRGKYRVRITVDGKTHSIGTFNTEQEAAIEYDNAARRLRGQQATKFNFPGIKIIVPKVVRQATKLALKEPIWTSSDGRRTPISLLANNHLRNIERMLRYRGARIPPEGTQAHWYTVISNELYKRGLEKLEDHPNQLEEIVEIPVYMVSRNGRTTQKGHALISISDLPRVQHYNWFDHGMRGDGKPHVPVRTSKVKDGLTRSLDSFITGNIKYRIIHRSGNPRDCTRRNLFVDIPGAIYKVRADDYRVPLSPQGVSGHADEPLSPEPEIILQDKVATNDNKKRRPRAAKGAIRAHLSDE